MNHTNYQQVFNVQGDNFLLTNVHEVVCIFMRRGVLSAGFNAQSELLTIHYNGYKGGKPVWDIDFFEHIITQDALLNKNHQKITRVFTCSERNMLIPEALYNAEDARKWMEKIHFIDAQDSMETFHLADDKAYLLQLMPREITELIRIHFKNAKLMPLALYHFRNNHTEELNLKCCISNEQCCLTLHQGKKLLWHRIFDYANVADIAYEIQYFCKQHHVEPNRLAMNCTCITETEQNIVAGLYNFFNSRKPENGKEEKTANVKWKPAVSLLQQLFLCA